MWDYMQFWFAKAVAELAVGLIALGVLFGFGLLCMLPGVIRKFMCRHPSYRCTYINKAVCNKCDKVLGPIHTVRREHPAKRET